MDMVDGIGRVYFGNLCVHSQITVSQTWKEAMWNSWGVSAVPTRSNMFSLALPVHRMHITGEKISPVAHPGWITQSNDVVFFVCATAPFC